MKSLRAESVDKSFSLLRERIHVSRCITHEFAAGEVTSIVGASGSGKSTLLHILGGLDRPDAGRVLIDDVSLYDLGAAELSRWRNRRIGFVFQAYHLLPELSAEENVMLPGLIGGRAAMNDARALLDQVGLGSRMRHRPAELSGGEQQRVAIARALINSPDLVLADEPTGNLDSKNGAAVLDLLLALQRDRRLSLVLVTHDPAIAACGSHRLVLQDGELLK
jgi:ABC-type lipoprotein export system ATPase subunit